jgi:hypothetical protein
VRFNELARIVNADRKNPSNKSFEATYLDEKADRATGKGRKQKKVSGAADEVDNFTTYVEGDDEDMSSGGFGGRDQQQVNNDNDAVMDHTCNGVDQFGGDSSDDDDDNDDDDDDNDDE